MSTFLKADLDNAQQCLLETFELAAEYGDNETQNMNDYLTLMERICQIRDDSERYDRALEQARNERTMADFEATFNRLLSSNNKKFNAKKTNEYKKFKQRLEQISNVINNGAASTSTHQKRQEDDIFIMESQLNINDPITRKRLVDPMRNNICSHVYEKSSILEAIHMNPRLRCPVAGCGNKHFIEAGHLIPDSVFKMKLKQIAETELNDDADD